MRIRFYGQYDLHQERHYQCLGCLEGLYFFASQGVGAQMELLAICRDFCC